MKFNFILPFDKIVTTTDEKFKTVLTIGLQLYKAPKTETTTKTEIFSILVFINLSFWIS